MHRRLHAYKRVHVSTASPADLVIMLYDGMIKQVHVARRALGARMFADAGASLDRALAIVAHLRGVLDTSVSPEVAESLDKTYAAWTLALVRAQAKGDADAFAAVAEQMQALRGAWDEARRHTAAQANGA